MDPHSHHPEDLNELEQCLSAWQPDRRGLDADAVLFAAGRASVRSGPARFAWPAVTALLTALAVVLGLSLMTERRERQALATRLQERPPAPVVPPSAPSAVPVPEESPATSEPPPDSLLTSRRALDQGLDAWPSQAVAHGGPPVHSAPNPPILSLGQRDALLEP